MNSTPALLAILVASVVFVVLATTRAKLHPFLALLLAALGLGVAAGLPAAKTVPALIAGFGRTAGAIGIVIACGAIIGAALERSGGALTMGRAVMHLLGPRRALAGVAGTGAVVSVPVFCDSGYVLLSPLARAIARQGGVPLAGTVVALGMGLYTTHCLVPPTPGPIAVAGELRADLGTVILLGAAISLPVLATILIYARTLASRLRIDGEVTAAATPAADTNDGPSSTLTFLPVTLPVVLIALRSIADFPGSLLAFAKPFLGFVGEPNIALLLGVAAALPLLRGTDDRRDQFAAWCKTGIQDAGPIILITAAGGAFGAVLRETPLATTLGQLASAGATGGSALWVAFALAAALKTSLGSSTVAMITTSSLLASLLPAMGLGAGFGPALAAVAISAGAMAVSHVNDSYFWVITQFSKLTVTQGYRLVTLPSALAGLTAMVCVWLLSLMLL